MLGPKRDDVRVLAVSVDPEGDTPKAVDAYAKAHHLLPEFHYLVGSRHELNEVWKAYDVAAVASDPELVDHTAYTMLVDASGDGRVIYDSQVKAKAVVHDVDRASAPLPETAQAGLQPGLAHSVVCLRSYGTRVMRFCDPGDTGELSMK